MSRLALLGAYDVGRRRFEVCSQFTALQLFIAVARMLSLWSVVHMIVA